MWHIYRIPCTVTPYSAYRVSGLRNIMPYLIHRVNLSRRAEITNLPVVKYFGVHYIYLAND